MLFSQTLTRPPGATLGDLFDKPLKDGGFAFSRYSPSAILAALIIACIVLLPQRAATRSGGSETAAR